MTLEDVQAVVDSEAPATIARASELLLAGETIVEHWLRATGREPTGELREGFRILALQRQGASTDASFNACRETCRELVFHFNVVKAAAPGDNLKPTIQMMGFVARHLLFFISGKLVEQGLGQFCCAARPLRSDGG